MHILDHSRLAIACCLVLISCDPESELPADDFRVQWLAMDGNFELAQDGSVASFATGSVEILMRDANGWPQWIGDKSADFYLRGTCGVTFISPRYAITAGHCVDAQFIQDPVVHTVPVTTYDITKVDKDAFLFSSILEGEFPYYTPLARADEFDGYETQTYECTVTSRCGNFGPPINCNVPFQDVAMLFCPDRGFDEEWLQVAASDPGTGPVEMYWFHELLHVPTEDPGAGDPEHERFEHYTALDTSKREENYHYLSGDANTLLPLRSTPWPDGAERSRVGGGWTDLFGCHGTSGSGVLQRNAQGDLELLGPVVHPNESWGSTRLCTRLAGFEKGARNISYTANAAVRELVAQYESWLYWDRIKVDVEPPKG